MDRRLFLTGLAATIPTRTFATPPTTAFVPEFRNVENVQRLAASSSRQLDPSLASITSFALYDTVSGKLIDAHQPNLALPPASVTKAVTAIYSRHVLGPDFRFQTKLMITGSVEDGIVQGDMYLVGGGDPALDTDELASIAKSAVANGIRGLTGNFFVDNSALPLISEIDSTQPDYLGYNPTIGGLNLNFNRVFFEWKSAAGKYELNLDARSERYRPAVSGIYIDVENRQAPIFQYSEITGQDYWSVARSALGDNGGRWLPVRHPADYASEVFSILATNFGLRLPRPFRARTPRNAVEVAQFSSETLDTTLKWLLKYSNNLTAECIGLTSTRKLGFRPVSLQQSADKMGKWSKSNLGVSTTGLLNHSGLNDRSRISASDMARLLGANTSRSHLSDLLKTFELPDRDGNAFPMQGAVINAKTGTLNFTRGLAGYISKNGRQYSFAIFAADLAKRSNIPMTQRERPIGAKSWSSRAKRQEKNLLRHWVNLIS